MANKSNESEFITDFITVYKEHPVLWHVKSPDYINRNLKDAGYKTLLKIYEKYQIENASVDTVKKTIQSLRAAFRRELKKNWDLKKSGAGTEDLEEYTSTLWYFSLLLFTAENEEARPSTSSLMDSEDVLDVEVII